MTQSPQSDTLSDAIQNGVVRGNHCAQGIWASRKYHDTVVGSSRGSAVAGPSVAGPKFIRTDTAALVCYQSWLHDMVEAFPAAQLPTLSLDAYSSHGFGNTSYALTNPFLALTSPSGSIVCSQAPARAVSVFQSTGVTLLNPSLQGEEDRPGSSQLFTEASACRLGWQPSPCGHERLPEPQVTGCKSRNDESPGAGTG